MATKTKQTKQTDDIKAPVYLFEPADAHERLIEWLKSDPSDATEAPEWARDTLARRHPGAVWVRLDSVSFAKEGQIRGARDRSTQARAMSRDLLKDPLTTPPIEVVKPDVASLQTGDGYARGIAFRLCGYHWVPAVLHPMSEFPSMTPLAAALYLGALFNVRSAMATGMSATERAEAAVKMMDAGISPEDERLTAATGYRRQALYNLRNEQRARAAFIEYGAKPDMVDKASQAVVLQVWRMVCQPDDDPSMPLVRRQAAVQLIDSGRDAKGVDSALAGAMTSPKILRELAKGHFPAVAPPPETTDAGKPKPTTPAAPNGHGTETPTVGGGGVVAPGGFTTEHVQRVDPYTRWASFLVAALHGDSLESLAELVEETKRTIGPEGLTNARKILQAVAVKIGEDRAAERAKEAAEEETKQTA